MVDLELKIKKTSKALNRNFDSAKTKAWAAVKPALLWLLGAMRLLKKFRSGHPVRCDVVCCAVLRCIAICCGVV